MPEAPGAEPVGSPGLLKKLEPFEGRLVRSITLSGVPEADVQLVRNQLRTLEGSALRLAGVQGDISRLNRLGRFKQITARVTPFDDASVGLVYELVQTPTVKDVQVVGNRELGDKDLAAEVTILTGTPIDPYQIDRSLRKLRDLYRKKGYYQADVSVDQKELDENNILLFRIREGERLRVTDIRFDGVKSFEDKEIFPKLTTKTWGIFDDGVLDDNVLDQDVAEVMQFYKDRGHLDVRVDRRIMPSPNLREAVVTFVVDEGPAYTLRSVRWELAEGGQPTGRDPTVFSRDQIAALIPLKPGDLYRMDKVRKSVEAVSDAYGKMGYVDVRVGRLEIRDPGAPVVDLLVHVSEGRAYKTGSVEIVGNELTQQKVVRRQVLVKPDRPLDATEIKRTEDRLNESRLFAGLREGKSPRVTVQPENPEEPDHRDVLVEVQETNTGSLQFGAAVSSDAGLIGSVSFSQRNFDLTDTPDSFGEFIRGRAFRGAGQDFSINLQPGTKVQTYTIALGDGHLFESDYAGSTSGGYRRREYDEYNEARVFGKLQIGRAFGERWVGTVQTRADSVELSDIDPNEPVDVLSSEGNTLLTGLAVRLQRSTLDSQFHPSKGSVFYVQAERVGLFGGDEDFTPLGADHRGYLTINEDMLGRKTILSSHLGTSYIPEGQGEVPVFERFYLGGRDFRGFKYRGVSPRGFRRDTGGNLAPSDRPIGGTFSFFAGLQIEQPLWENFLSGVVFVDSGTVRTGPGFGEYRVAVGVGVRINLPVLGQAPLALDFGFPVKKETDDERRLFSFSVDLPL